MPKINFYYLAKKIKSRSLLNENKKLFQTL